MPELKKNNNVAQTAVQRQPEVPTTETDANGLSRQPQLTSAPLPLPPPRGAANRARQFRQMQRGVGNGRISRMSQPKVQTKLTVGAPNDAYEQEADRVADQVMRMPEPMGDEDVVQRKTAVSSIQRMCPACNEKLQQGKPDEMCPTCRQSIQRKPDIDIPIASFTN